MGTVVQLYLTVNIHYGDYIMQFKPKAAISTALATVALTTGSVMLNQSAAKAWFNLPSGVYANVQGKQFYLGDFVQRPDPQCPVACSWAVRYNGNLSAHGNGRTPAWLMTLIRNWR
jgi:hypothetical protein